MDYWGRIELDYDDDTLNHIAKHGVFIEEVLHILKHSKKVATKLKGNYYLIIGEYYGRCLTIIIEKEKGNKFILKTARDCSNSEKKRYRRKHKK
ncbi:MAG: hypothetical protein R6U44_04295 [Archaeoglobaceae archaeon]